jgi:WD40 repeat protein
MYTLTNIDAHRSASDAYVLDVRRTAAGLAAISSDQTLALLDPSRLSAGPLSRPLPVGHGAGVAALRVFDWAGSLVCTAGEDGGVAVWDLRQGGIATASSEVARFSASTTPILSLACDAATQTIAVGTELQNHTASVHIWDVRSTPAPKVQYNEVHSDDVTSLAFHPGNPALLLSGSTDGLVNVCDTRITDEDEAVVQTVNHNASIHHAAWLAPSRVLALSHDEQFALYDVAEDSPSGDALRDFGDLRAALGCQYVASVEPKADGSGAVLGAGSQDKSMFELVFLADANGAWTLDRENGVGLPGAHGDEIVRSFCFFDEEQVVYTAGEDGSVKAWRPS